MIDFLLHYVYLNGVDYKNCDFFFKQNDYITGYAT